MKTLLIDALIALAVAAAGAGICYRLMSGRLHAATARAEAAEERANGLAKARAADQASLTQLGQKKAAIARSGASARHSLAAASAPVAVEYLDQPVPQEVLDAIK